MFNISLPSFLSRRNATASASAARQNRDAVPITLPAVPVRSVETLSDRPSRTLKHLLKANHANHSVVYNSLRFENHTPHVLGAAYALGATARQLDAVYAAETARLEPWRDSPGEVSRDDWRDFCGRREYQRAFVDFFEDQVVRYGYDWRAVLRDYVGDADLDEDEEEEMRAHGPLLSGMAVGGLGHPLIHLGYALELDSRDVAVEALALGACFYGREHKYLDDARYTRPPPADGRWPTTPLGLLRRAARDPRFDGLFEERGGDNLARVFAEREDALLEYWNAWRLSRGEAEGEGKDAVVAQFRDSQRAAAAVLVCTKGSEDRGQEEKFDFFLCHVLTTSHAVRVLLPMMESRWHANLARGWWLFAAAAYIAQMRPRIAVEGADDGDAGALLADVQLDGRDWGWVTRQALEGPWRLDAHFVKACRAMKVAAETWGDEDQFYIRAAVKFAGEFDGWGGFAERDPEAEEVRRHAVS